MQIKIFTVPILGGDDANEEMNHFLASHRIVEVQQELVAGQYWTFCVRYLLGVEKNGKPQSFSKNGKVDYRDLLSDAEFARFSTMRALRKQMAAEEAIPAYSVFTDAQLAAMSQIEELSLSKMQTVDGIGQARAEKYGPRMIDALKKDEEVRQSDSLDS